MFSPVVYNRGIILDKNRCFYCGKRGSKFERATYVEAPEDGVLLHKECLKSFFDKIAEDYWYPPRS